MTPEEKEALRRELADHITGTIDEWLRSVIVDTEDHRFEGKQLRVSWEAPTDGAMIASLREVRDGDPIARYGVQIIVDTLPDLPPSGPEDDLGVFGIDESMEWTPATMLDAQEGDRIRLGQEEATVLARQHGEWHVDNRDEYRPKRWDHVELRLSLDVVPALTQYPPNLSIEILMGAERRAAQSVLDAFPGSAIISSDVD